MLKITKSNSKPRRFPLVQLYLLISLINRTTSLPTLASHKSSVIKCALECEHNGACYIFSYDSGLCELYGFDGYDNIQETIEKPSTYIRIENGTYQILTKQTHKKSLSQFACPPLSDKFANITYASRVTYGTLASYSCKTGLFIRGTDKGTRTCERGGKWSGTNLQCSAYTGCLEAINRSPDPQSNIFWVDFDGDYTGVDPFQVECDLETAEAIIHHSFDNSSIYMNAYTQSEGLLVRNTSTREIIISLNYSLPDEYIDAIHLNSANCSQYINWDCFSAYMTHGRGMLTYWVTWDGRRMTNWGGAPWYHTGCACSFETDGCFKSSRQCNCDANDKIWRSDGGLLTNATNLPVSIVNVQDVDDTTEAARLTVGPLKCYK